MARELNDSLELAEENENYRDTFYMLRSELARIRREYFLGAELMTASEIDEVDSELETLTLALENSLF